MVEAIKVTFKNCYFKVRNRESGLIFNDDTAPLIRPLTAHNVIPLAVSITNQTLVENVSSFSHYPGALSWDFGKEQVHGSQNNQSRR
jgi:hypothetical protein